MGRWERQSGEIAELVSPRLLRLAYLLLGDELRARHLVADVLRTYARRPAGGERSPYPQARALLVEHLARPRLPRLGGAPVTADAAPPPAEPGTAFEPEQQPGHAPEPGDELRRAEEADATALAAAVRALPIRPRLVVVLAHFERLAADLIADDLGSTVRSVRREHDRALGILAALPVPAVLATRPIEQRLTAALVHEATQLDADVPITLAAPARTGRARRVMIAAAVGLIVVGGAIWLRPQTPEPATPVAGASSPGQIVTPSAQPVQDDEDWPTRGSLAGDRLFLAEIRRRAAAEELGAVRILYAGDVRDRRIVITRSTEPPSWGDDTLRSIHYFVAARGATVESMSVSETSTQPAPMALAYLPRWISPGWTLILGPASLSRVELSDEPTYGVDGSVNRTFRPVDLVQGLAVVPTTARGPGQLLARQPPIPGLGDAKPLLITPAIPDVGPVDMDPRLFLPPGVSPTDFDLTGDCTRDPSSVRMTIHRTELTGVTDWELSGAGRFEAAFAVIRRADGTAFRSVVVQGVPGDSLVLAISCAPVPAATADLLPYVSPVNNGRAYLVLLPRSHAEVATAEIRTSGEPTAPVLGRAAVRGQYALITLLNPTADPPFSIIDPRTATVTLRDRRGRVLLTCPVQRRSDNDPFGYGGLPGPTY